MIEIKVRDQNAVKVNDPVIASGSHNFVELKVTFSSNWEGLTKSYQFTNTKGLKYQEVAFEEIPNGEIVRLHEKFLLPGYLCVSIKGVDCDNNVKATTNYLKYKVHDSMLTDNPDNAGDMSPAIIDQITAKADNAVVTADEAKGLSVAADETAKAALKSATSAKYQSTQAKKAANEAKALTEGVNERLDNLDLQVKDGEDGYTPFKGIDYFTEGDKAEIVEAVAEIIAEYFKKN